MKELRFREYRITFSKEGEYADISFFINGQYCTGIHLSINSKYYPVFRIFGNKVYKNFKEHRENISTFDFIILDYYILFGDFNAYSDSFKDINYFRPRMSKDDWERLVQEKRKEYGYNLGN